MTASFSLALQAAHQAAAAQHYPQGALYLVATPIGNLADISLRALHVLQLADAIACEDTRHTRQLLQSYGIDKGPGALIAAHQHNERAAAQALIERLRQGQRIAYVSDAGTPAISDPGAILAAQVRQAGLAVVPIPGASSVSTALSAAGLMAPDGDSTAYVFAGFLPPKGKARQAAIAAVQAEARATALLEAPHRIAALAQELAALGQRPVTLARELTKQFEQIHTLPAQEMPAWLAADPQRQKGEFVLIIHPQPVAPTDALPDDAQRLLRLLLAEGVSLKSAARITATHTGAPRNALYELGLSLDAH
ncbi:16S rRNA (cytidine(1402)-2'-O)-methyltransferase [Allofranklinella schreckenbergeri]|uniref:Ribosomal RNA small subunit methyltransferase I n=1 Tax=Allofranklinella schreckenbergeri TaxID=1076744 RepID=A0A3M6QDP8_9BURK|nr:16S rRNA (cytidine(1402)-2'-O)-methyltransferase [Allofranklinella schreckenbergeri]RMX01015.1 16S rRNA (cytidine(1402)-2'-O)-methyltransferase [Allofranklinella schreckenbergeri]